MPVHSLLGELNAIIIVPMSLSFPPQTKANDVRKEIRIGFTHRRRLMPYVGLEDRIDRAY